MAFDPKLLTGNTGTGGNAPQAFTYSSAVDLNAAIAGSGYFNKLKSVVKVGDVIYSVDSGNKVAILLIAGISGAGVVTTTSFKAEA